MSEYKIGPKDGLYYEHRQPTKDTASTYVFFNALTGDTTNWEAVIGPVLRRAGHGTLAYNMRGQANSPFSPDTVLDMNLIVDDAVRLLSAVEPVRPILVGLSIGGLFAARTWLKGFPASALVLINTLRKNGARLKWIGDALVRAVEVGGLELFRDLYLPLLVNEEWLASNRDAFLKTGMSYGPLKPNSGHYKLLAEAGRTSDWDLPYEKIDLPVLVVTGLQDHVFLEKTVVDELAMRLPKSSRSDMLNAGHLIPAEQPEALADVLLSFAKEVA
jgi:pimeloyl-ACP methyl ester carboxylesterase